MRGRIQVSSQTADVLRECGKGSWLTPREDIVIAKGLGRVSTFWLDAETQSSSVDEGDHSNPGQAPSYRNVKEASNFSKKLKGDRLVDWMTELLAEYVKKVVSSILLWCFLIACLAPRLSECLTLKLFFLLVITLIL